MNAEAPKADVWWDRATCRGTDWSLWAPLSKWEHQKQIHPDRYVAAAAICARCPVVAECRRDADTVPDPAFRAGWSARDRERQNGGRW